MFWYLWFPLIGFALTIIISLVSMWKNSDLDSWGMSIVYGLVIGALFFVVGLFIALESRMTTKPTAIGPESETPIYLVSLTNDEKLSGKFLWASGSFSQYETLRYYYYLPGTEKIVFGEVATATAIILEDNPVKPYFNNLVAICPPDTFWRIGCDTTIKYTTEFHIPKNSIYREISLTP
jgi:hypothetical protein